MASVVNFSSLKNNNKSKRELLYNGFVKKLLYFIGIKNDTSSPSLKTLAFHPVVWHHSIFYNHFCVLVSSVLVSCSSLVLLSVGPDHSCTCVVIWSILLSFLVLTHKLCWCQMSSVWQLDGGWSILTGSPVSLCFLLPSEASSTHSQSLFSLTVLSHFLPAFSF